MDRQLKKLSNRINSSLREVEQLVDGNGDVVWNTFHRLPLRTGTDYYKVIMNPISLHSVKQKAKKGQYTNAQDFIRDLAQITWNARLYNERGSIFYDHALILDNYLRDKILPRMTSDKSIVNHQELFYPDLGPLPDDDGEGSGGVESEIPQYGMMEEDYDDNGNEGDYDDIQTTPKARPYDASALVPGIKFGSGSNTPISIQSPYLMPGSSAGKLESGIRRGRPPTVDKPYETRIKLILKNFKKLRHPHDMNRALASFFDKLPDKNNGDYYRIIKDPISLSEIRAKLRARKYRNVDEFLNDLNLMFHNNKIYFGNDQYSTIYQDCLLFEDEANKIINVELLKLETDLLSLGAPGSDGILRFPLDSLELNGYTYKVGDWVLINNANNPDKPTVGQIFRLWSTKDGTQYTNVCWYYRPEQTCHRYDRLFFINEVCKTGQYRDHLASEIVGPCYVIFLTRYQKGDLPKGIIPDGCPWFICEFRYNETSHVFNRIRTWRACLPDETRDNPEPPVVPLKEPRKLIKYESPIKSLLPQGADITMPIPEITPGPTPNTPPLLGSVYIRDPDVEDDLGQYYTSANVVPSPENDDSVNHRKAYIFTPISQSKSFGSGYPVPNQPSTLTATTTATATTAQPPMQSIVPPPMPIEEPNKSYLASVNRYRQSVFQQSQHQPIPQPTPAPQFSVKEPKRQPMPMNNYHTSTSTYSSLLPGGVVSYTTEDEFNQIGSISEDIKKRKADNEIIWYRGPPLVRSSRIIGEGAELGHSAKYLAWKKRSL